MIFSSIRSVLTLHNLFNAFLFIVLGQVFSCRPVVASYGGVRFMIIQLCLRVLIFTSGLDPLGGCIVSTLIELPISPKCYPMSKLTSA